ncbi:MAG TPA: hypothetical protein VN363_09800, partial [Anaerolineales bacterium]|nr:hypothetical protein [Anaerolineales bacterium]
MKARSCPYLGLEYDPSTYQAFPSGENFCHKARVPGPVDQQYQATVCLTDAYPGCPIFAGEGAALGSAGRAPALPRLSRKAFLFLLAGAVVVGLSLLALLLPGAKNIGAFFSSPTDSPFPPTVTQTRIVVVEGQVTPTPENLSLPLIWRQPTGTPLPTATSTQTPTVT